MTRVQSHDFWSKAIHKKHPPLFKRIQTRLRPDMVLWSDTKKTVLIVELTVPWESNMEWAYERKTIMYLDMQNDCTE